MKFLLLFFIQNVFAKEIQIYEPNLYWNETKIYSKMANEKYIAVSAKIEKVEKIYTMRLISAGIIKTPINYTYSKITDYQNYPQITDHFEKCEFNSKDSTLFIVPVAFSYKAPMLLKLKNYDFPEKDLKVIEWESIEGTFIGMKGEIKLKSYLGHSTEISLWSNYNSNTIPLPKILLGPALEVIGQKIASLIRSYIETQFKKG